MAWQAANERLNTGGGGGGGGGLARVRAYLVIT